VARGGVPSSSHEQCLERGKETASQSIGTAQLDAAADRGATGVRRETAAAYLKAAGVAVGPSGGWGRRAPVPAKLANTVTTEGVAFDSEAVHT